MSAEPVCEWFARCTNEAAILVAHPAFSRGIPTCQRCAEKLDLEGTPLPHWEAWFKLLWNAALEVVDDADVQRNFSPEDEPMLYALLETMHGIAEGQPSLTQEGCLTDLK